MSFEPASAAFARRYLQPFKLTVDEARRLAPPLATAMRRPGQ